MNSPKIVCACLFGFALLSSAHCQTDGSLSFPGKDWESAPAAMIEKRWDTAKLKKLQQRWAEVESGNLASALFVVDSGYLIFEGGKTRKPIPCHSVRKSFLNALYGVADREPNVNLQASLRELGMTDGGKLSTEEGEATVLQVLQSRSGVYLPAEYETDRMKELRPARFSHLPGSFYYYNNWDFNVAGAIFRKWDSRGIGAAFQADIADPIGMQDFDHQKHTELFHASPPQSEYPAYPFLMSARDRARFGLLYLAEGVWGKNRILSEGWVEKTVTPYSNHEQDGFHETKRPRGSRELGSGAAYGLLWWVSDTGWLFGQKFEGVPFSARGYYGQIIAVIPSENLVVVFANDKRVEGQKKTPGNVRNELFELILGARK